MTSLTTDQLCQRYYYGRADFVDATTEFHRLICASACPGAAIVEIGAGPSNPTSRFLAMLGPVTGIDVSEEVLKNRQPHLGPA